MSKAKAETKVNDAREPTWVWVNIRQQNRLAEREEPRPPTILIAPQNWYMCLGLIACYAGFTTGIILNGWFSLFL